jgi:7-keto-8-aminopelargonate synthetase-like enzyme
MMDWIEEELKKTQQQKLLRRRTLREGLIDLCSNDYLGLREHPEVKEEAIKVIKDYGVGSGASALVSGCTNGRGKAKAYRKLEIQKGGLGILLYFVKIPSPTLPLLIPLSQQPNF